MELTLIIARLAERLDLAAGAERVPDARGLVASRPIGGAPTHVRGRPETLSPSSGTPDAPDAF